MVLAESRSGVATQATARGKLAPQRIAGGRTAQRQRRKSSWKRFQGFRLIQGLMGQLGSQREMACADQAMANMRRNWQRPKRRRGETREREAAAAALEPRPRPRRKTARIM